MRYCVIYNPHARNGRARASAERCLALLSRSDAAIEAVEVRHFEDAHVRSREANLAGYDAVVAVGGDGTINRVLNGFYDDAGQRNSGARFGVVHTGTSPDFCRSYGLPLDVDGATRALIGGRSRQVPVGMIRFLENGNAAKGSSTSAIRGVSYFVCCANIGLGASLAARANAGIRARLGDTLGTFWSLLQVLHTYTPEAYNCIVDGERTHVRDIYNISIGLTPYIASGIKVASEEYQRAGMFYMMTLRALGARNLLPMLGKIYSGKKFRDTEYISMRGCASIRIEGANARGDVEHDGDPCGTLPCEILRAEPLDLLH